jgi:hypothetical protein
VAYYVIPRATRSPLYSHTLSLLGFWSLIVVYTHIGTHHLLQVPVPTWLKVVAIVDSVAMVIPVMAFLINIWYTAKGKLGEIHADIGAKFVFTGTIMYFFVSIQGSMMALPDVQRVTHFNNWVVAHAHIGVLGFAGMIALGGLYFILPKITGRPLFSRFLADLQYWMVLIGMVGFTIVLTIAGLIQGNAWLNGETVYRVLPEIHACITSRRRPGAADLHLGPAGLLQHHEVLAGQARSDAMKMTPLAVIVGSVLILATIVFVVVSWPYADQQNRPSEIFRVRTAEEAAGRAIYIQNGCVYCHSQSIRTIDWDWGPNASPRPATTWPIILSCSAPSAPGRTSPRPAASTPTTGTWPTSSIRATRGRSRSCRPSNGWARKKLGHPDSLRPEPGAQGCGQAHGAPAPLEG